MNGDRDLIVENMGVFDPVSHQLHELLKAFLIFDIKACLGVLGGRLTYCFLVPGSEPVVL